jgi:hypothetical protein
MPTVTIDGEEHDVDASQVAYGEDESPDGYVHQDDVDGIVQKRLSRKERQMKDDLKQDDEFFREAATARGIELREDGRPKGAVKDDELQELRRKASEAESLQERVQEYESQMEETRRTQLHNEVLSSLNTPPQEGAKDDILATIERQATYDEEYGWVVTNEDGDIAFEGGEPVTPDEYASSTLPEKKPYLFKSTEMGGGPQDDPGGSGGKRTWSREEYEQAAQRTHKMDDEEFEDWDTAAEEGRIEE